MSLLHSGSKLPCTNATQQGWQCLSLGSPSGIKVRKKRWAKKNRSKELLGVNQHLGVTPNWGSTNFFFMSLTWEQKKLLFGDFQVFFTILDHANACATMRLLVKIHNRLYCCCSFIKMKSKKNNTWFLPHNWCQFFQFLHSSWRGGDWFQGQW